MISLIAETAWHHEGDFAFMKDLVSRISEESNANIIKMHITLDFDEYMQKDHPAYNDLKGWLFTEEQWDDLINIVKKSQKDLMLLLNDTKAIEFASSHDPALVELHSVCLNVPRLQQCIQDFFNKETRLVVGVGGCTIEEVDYAVEAFTGYPLILMFGFQNYPTRYQDINLSKIRKIQSLYPDKIFGYADHTGWDEQSNELITLAVAANEMSYVEKHVTTLYGKERCDYSAAVSIEMFNKLTEKIKVLDQIQGSGELGLNEAETKYSTYGLMKMAPVMKLNKKKGDELMLDDIHFSRTGQNSDLSQLDVLNRVGSALKNNIEKGQVLNISHLEQ